MSAGRIEGAGGVGMSARKTRKGLVDRTDAGYNLLKT
jgi:hypothetical protein